MREESQVHKYDYYVYLCTYIYIHVCTYTCSMLYDGIHAHGSIHMFRYNIYIHNNIYT